MGSDTIHLNFLEVLAKQEDIILEQANLIRELVVINYEKENLIESLLLECK